MTATLTTRALARPLSYVALALAITVMPELATAQGDDVSTASRVNLGPVGLSPRFGWQVEHEDNVFRTSERHASDMVTTLSGATNLRARLWRVGVSARGSADWVHFSELIGERGANADGDLRLDFLFNRIVPYASTSYRNTRRRQNSEIDVRPRIEHSSVTVGGLFRLGGKTSADLSASQVEEVLDPSATVDDVNLSEALNRKSHHVSLSLLQAVTPLTRLAVTGEVHRDQFSEFSNRSADNIRVTAGFESSGRINGRARAGMRVLTPRDATLPKTRVFVGSLGMSVTLLDRVQIGLDAERDAAPSYRPGVAYFGRYSYGGTVAYAMRRSLRISALAERRVADYRIGRAAIGSSPANQAGVERQTRYGCGISYLLGDSMAIDFGGAYTERTSDLDPRRFNGVTYRVGINHAF